MMKRNGERPTPHTWPANYEIRIAGHLDEAWADRFEGLTIIHEDDGNTLLCGRIVDQTALQSILLIIGRLNLALLSVNQIETKSEKDSKTSRKAEN
jgi:hypothetical protein